MTLAVCWRFEAGERFGMIIQLNTTTATTTTQKMFAWYENNPKEWFWMHVANVLVCSGDRGNGGTGGLWMCIFITRPENHVANAHKTHIIFNVDDNDDDDADDDGEADADNVDGDVYDDEWEWFSQNIHTVKNCAQAYIKTHA